MKKQNVNNKLAFTKASVIELNDDLLTGINGGSSWGCVIATIALYYEVTMDIHDAHHK